MDPYVKLVPNEETIINQRKYAKIIGSIMDVMNHTTPELAYAIGILSRLTSNPS